MSEKKAPRWTQRVRPGMEALAIVASKNVRSPGVPPGRTLGAFLETHRKVLGTYFILSTWGTYFDNILEETEKKRLAQVDELTAYDLAKARWKSKLPWMQYGYSLRPGKLGGITELAEHLEVSAGSDRIRVLIFITDPDDLEESYPEDRALIRAAIRNKTIFLSTHRSASLWAAFEADGRPRRRPSHTKPTNPEDETLALIAHDAKKLDLCRWAVDHRHRIRRFRTIITTGTTGDWVAKFLVASGVRERQIQVIQPMASGPFGGDVEIAGEVLRKKCHHIVFFVDPGSPHPHEADIQTLLRTCTMPDVDVNLRTTEPAATSWVNTLKPARR